MPYTVREAMTVALYNAGCEPLHKAFDVADDVISGLKTLGWDLVDTYDQDEQDVAGFLSKAALQVVPDL